MNNRFDFKDAEEYSRLSCHHYNQQQSQMVSIANLQFTKELLTEEEIFTAWLAGLHFGEYFHLFQKKSVFNEWMKYGENNVNGDIYMIPKSIYICSF